MDTKEKQLEKLSIYSKLYQVLALGRAIPDRNGGGTVFESKKSKKVLDYLKAAMFVTIQNIEVENHNLIEQTIKELDYEQRSY